MTELHSQSTGTLFKKPFFGRPPGPTDVLDLNFKFLEFWKVRNQWSINGSFSSSGIPSSRIPFRRISNRRNPRLLLLPLLFLTLTLTLRNLRFGELKFGEMKAHRLNTHVEQNVGLFHYHR